jgi:FkbM family methyltransferase
MSWRDLLRRTADEFGYAVHRWPSNRFEGGADALRLLKQRHYSPSVVIDGGANVGQWTRMASAIFPDAEFHLIEPQPSCLGSLQALARTRPRTVVHSVATTAPGVSHLTLTGILSTGAHVPLPGETPGATLQVTAITLDQLLAARVGPEDRALLKLDLEGHELAALQGASRLLRNVEVILTEVQFFHAPEVSGPTFSDLHDFLHGTGFRIYDVAALAGRRRDHRLRQADIIFVSSSSPLATDRSWE